MAPKPLLLDFTDYCRAHPQERFWQALRNWSGHNFIFASPTKDGLPPGAEDTFYWKDAPTGQHVAHRVSDAVAHSKKDPE